MIEELRVNFPLAFVDGKIDRKRLGSCALANDQEVILLNAITHKYIISKIKSLLAAHKDSDIAIDGFNLCEGELAEICDCLVGVISPKNLRIDRITIRDKISTDYALKRIDAQPSDEYYRSKCDYILENNGDLSGFLDKCNLLFTKILEG
jgi:dephospho-CoA kinase